MNKKSPEKAIGLRVPPELYDQIVELSKLLDEIPINTFAQRSVECAIEMLTAEKPTIPKWINVGRYSLNYEKEAKGYLNKKGDKGV